MSRTLLEFQRRLLKLDQLWHYVGSSIRNTVDACPMVAILQEDNKQTPNMEIEDLNADAYVDYPDAYAMPPREALCIEAAADCSNPESVAACDLRRWMLENLHFA